MPVDSRPGRPGGGELLITGAVSRLGIATAHHWQPVAAGLYYSRTTRSPARLALAAPVAREPTDLIELDRELLRCWLVLGRHGLRVSVNSEIKDNPVTAAELPPGSFDVFSAGASTSRVPRCTRLTPADQPRPTA